MRWTMSQDDLAFLLRCEREASTHKKVGYFGADHTSLEIQAGLRSVHTVRPHHIEAALYSFQILERECNFKHPDGINYTQLVKRVTPQGYVFNKDLGFFERIKK